jgi:hypothetical protein
VKFRKIESKHFFFEKKKQKTFGYFAVPLLALCGLAGHQQTKVFWFFFSKKNMLSSFPIKTGQ